MPRRRRSRWRSGPVVGLGLVMLVCAVVAAALLVLRGGGSSGGSSAATAAGAPALTRTGTSLTRKAPANLQAPGSTPLASTPAARRLTSHLDAILTPEGGQTGAMVEDLSTGRAVFERNIGVARPPASVEKLYTSIATLNLLGANARLHTTILATGHMGKHGTWVGNLYLHGGGDPTFGDGGWNQAYMGGYGPTASQLVAQLVKLGIRRVTGRLYGDESLFDSDRGGPATHNKPDTPDYGGELSALVYDHGMSAPRMPPPVFAAHELALTMRSEGIRVKAAAGKRVAPAGATQIASVSSPRLAVLLRLMNVPSDDLIADLLAKQLGARFLGEGSLAAGATEISHVLASRYGIDARVFDGSGLDRADRSSPADIVSLLAQVWNTLDGRILHASLPQVGRQGTLVGIGVGTPAVGRCVAKTGTLNNVTNLAGYCKAKDGHTVAFAMMLDGPSNIQAVTALSKAVGAIASY